MCLVLHLDSSLTSRPFSWLDLSIMSTVSLPLILSLSKDMRPLKLRR